MHRLDVEVELHQLIEVDVSRGRVQEKRGVASIVDELAILLVLAALDLVGASVDRGLEFQFLS